jgi:signal transduction histidine kinase
MYNKIQYLLFLLYFPICLIAQDIEIKIDVNFKKVDAIPYAKVYKDSTLFADIEELRLKTDQFVQIKETQYNAAFEKVHYWFYNRVNNLTDGEFKVIYDVADPHINELQLFIYKNDSLFFDSGLQGDYMPYDSREYKLRTFSWPVTLKTSATYDFFLKVNMHTEPILIPIEIWEQNQHKSHLSTQSLYFGILIGLFVIYILCSIALWIIYKEKIHLYFYIYVVANFFLILGYSGIGYQYIWTYSSILHNISRPLFVGITCIAFIFFSNQVLQFFELKRTGRLIKTLTAIIFILACILPFYRELPKSILRLSITIYYMSMLVIFFLIFVMMIKRLLSQNDFDSKFFLAAFLCLFIGFGINILVLHDIIPKNHLTSLIYYYTVVLELFIFLCYMSIKVFKIKLDNQQKELALTTERNNALNNLIIGTERERNRIATELHDSVGIDLSMADLKLKQHQNQKNINISAIRGLIQKVSTEMRNISHNLSTIQLKNIGLTKAIQQLALNLNKNSSTRYFLTIDNLNVETISEEFQLHIYRIIQECLNNIEKHAQAKKTHISLITEDESHLIIIRDDGIGMNEAESQGIGLNNIKSRVKLMSGHISISSKTDVGTLVTITIPRSITTKSNVL